MDLLARVSREGGRAKTDSFYSPTDQVAQGVTWSNAHRVTLGEIIEEIDWSGGDMQRPGLMKAVRRIEDGLSTGLIVARLDRFGRDTAPMLELERRIRKAGGVLVNLDGEFDTSTPEGELMFTNMAGYATYMRRQVERGWERAHSRHVLEHGVPTGRAPFGYRRRHELNLAAEDGVHSKSLVVYMPEAEHVPTIFARRARGDSFFSIAQWLNELGSRTRAGAMWRGGSVSALTKSRTYLGEVRFGDGIINANAHEPLVSETLWQAAQIGGKRSLPSAGKSLLTGLVRCAGCRYKLESSITMDRYRCPGKRPAGQCPAPVSIRRALLDEYVWNYMIRRAQEEKLALRAQGVEADGEVERLERELVAARLAEEAHHDNLDAIVTLGKARWNTIAAKHRYRIEDLEAQLGRLVSAEVVGDDEPPADWDALTAAPLEMKHRALTHGIDVVFLRGPAPRNGRRQNLAERVLILERGQGPSTEQLPRRGPRSVCAFACVPFPFSNDSERPATTV